MITASLKKGNNPLGSTFSGIEFTSDHYITLFTDTPYMQRYLNTFILATANTLISLFVVTMTAHVLSRYRFRGKHNTLISILVLQTFPVLLSMTVIYTLLSKANLIDTYTGLLLVYATGSLSFAMWLVKGYFDAIPTSLDEAAKIGGAGHLTASIQIILLLAKPILVPIRLVSFTGPWMDFILPTLMPCSKDKITLTIGIFGWIASNSAEDYMLFAAGALLVVVSITSLLVFTRKHITTGLASGAAKEQFRD